MSSRVSIREFCWPGDYDAAISLWQAAGLHNPRVDGPAALRLVAERNPGLFLLAVDEAGRVLGSVIGTFDGRRAYLYHVAVHPAARRQGCGRMLLEEVERRLWALGADKIRFMVARDNITARAFYESAGYSHDAHVISMSKMRQADAALSGGVKQDSAAGGEGSEK